LNEARSGFTEGFDTPDLHAASALLKRLAQQRASIGSMLWPARQ
jgi:hypothetical protein